MRFATLPLAAVAALLVSGGLAAAEAERTGRANVLLVSFDDLGDWIQPLDPTSPIAMPHLDRLARRGVLFRRAYCAAPQCNPSRTAFLSGLRPTTTGVYLNVSDWKRVLPGAAMLPHYFRQHGYASLGAGKIYHHVDRHFHDEDSFDDWLPFATDRLPPAKLNQLSRALTPEGEIEPLAPTFDWGPSPSSEAEMLDTRSADYAIGVLERKHDRPFFLAVGFWRPHLPYFAPVQFLDRFPAATMPLPPMKPDDLADVPAGARVLMRPWARMFRAIQQALDALGKWREAVAAYAAGASLADHQLGRVLDALDRSPHRHNTIVIALSDRGYHLGEKDHWTKFVLWEKANRVPLIIVAPGIPRAGTFSDQPVSLVDLYPTLVELCGLPPRSDLDGLSLVPQLRDPAAPRLRPALMTEQRGNHAVRTMRYRYIRYVDGGEELYDHEADPHEWTNLASDPRHRETLTAHRRWLPEREAATAPGFVSPVPPAR